MTILLLFLLLCCVPEARGNCVEMERLDWGWELVPGRTVRRQSRGLESCQQLCVNWTPCRASRFHPVIGVCQLSPYPPRPLPSTPTGGPNPLVSRLRDGNNCQQKHERKPCNERPCDVTETCVPVTSGLDYRCVESEVVGCPPGTFSMTEDDRFCVKQLPGSRNFREATAACEAEGLQVLSAESEQKMEAIRHTFEGKTNRRIWLDGVKKNGDWIWLTSGESLHHFDWNQGQPDDIPGDTCLAMNHQRDFRWHDIPCQASYAVVCQA